MAEPRGASEEGPRRRLESQELDAQKRQYVAARDQIVAQLENARLDRTRAKSLLDEKIGSQQAFDAADSQVRALSAQVASAEQLVKYTDELIKNAEIYAPIDGVVTVKKAFLGETVAPQGFGGAGSAGATFAVIVDLSSLEMEADINEQNVAKLSFGQPAEVALDAYPDKPYKARLRQMSRRTGRRAHKVKIEIFARARGCCPDVLPSSSEPQRRSTKAKPKIMVPSAPVVEIGGEKASSSSLTTGAFRPLARPGVGAQSKSPPESRQRDRRRCRRRRTPSAARKRPASRRPSPGTAIRMATPLIQTESLASTPATAGAHGPRQTR